MKYVSATDMAGSSTTYVQASLTEAPNFSGLDPETGEPWSPKKIVQLVGFKAVRDPLEIKSVCERVLSENEDQVAAYRAGKTKVFGFFVKRVLDLTRNGADPEVTQTTLRELL